MARKSKKKKLEELEAARIEERKSIKEKLEKEELYSPSVDPLIENYLDAFIIYKSMYEEWRDKGFPPTKLHENKAGAINEMKHPLAQHVETWNDKKNKILDALGMTNKRKTVPKVEKNDEKTPHMSTVSSLDKHREKWRNSG